MAERQYLSERVFGSAMEYIGLISGISGSFSAIQSGGSTQRGALVVAGVVCYALGKIYQSGVDRAILKDELDKRGLTKKL